MAEVEAEEEDAEDKAEEVEADPASKEDGDAVLRRGSCAVGPTSTHADTISTRLWI